MNKSAERVIDVAKLVGTKEIADRLDVQPNVVGNWILRYMDFPQPVVALSCGRVWDWDEVAAWCTKNGVPFPPELAWKNPRHFCKGGCGWCHSCGLPLPYADMTACPHCWANDADE